MNLFVVALASAVILVNQSAANAQAFGLQMGQKLEELNVKSDQGGQNYQIIPPLPHPDFENYMAVVTQKAGLCRVLGIGKTFSNDSYGSYAKSTFNSLENFLNSKYGPSKRFHFLKTKSIWNEDREWVMSILKNERVLSSYWGFERPKLPNDLRINLSVRALSSSESYLNIFYEFANIDACTEELKTTSNRGL